MVLHAVEIDEISVSRSSSSGLARATSFMYRVSVMPVYSHASGKTGISTFLLPVTAGDGVLTSMRGAGARGSSSEVVATANSASMAATVAREPNEGVFVNP
eukprot:scaffold114058_cov57-Phaeocystis_antarctica.AAC.2